MLNSMLILAESSDDYSVPKFIIENMETSYDVLRINDKNEFFSTFSTMSHKLRVVLMNENLFMGENTQTQEEVERQIIDAIKQLKIINSLPEIIVISAAKDIKYAVNCFKNGAYDFFSNPLNPEKIKLVLESILMRSSYLNKIEQMKESLMFKKEDFQKRQELLHSLIIKRRAEGELLKSDEIISIFFSKNSRGLSSIKELESYLTIMNEKYLSSDNKETILVVEDDDILLDNLRLFLSDKYNVLLAEDGGKAKELIRNNSIDLILLDIYLPDVNGVDLIDEIQGQINDAEIIAMSAYQEIEMAAVMMRKGACDYLSKPFYEIDLMNTVSRALQKRYLNLVVPEIQKCMLEKNLSKEEKIQLLNQLIKDKLKNSEPMYIKDVYHFFPELKEINIPETVPIPQSVIDSDITLFIDNLSKNLNKIPDIK
ncbi:response regulator [bacterium]|jgi:DNA-binding response OmpR family regulator|nr:response regulator [bacterium]